MRKKVIIINESDRKYSVEYWRERFKELSEEAGDVNRKHLVIYDGYFLTAVGKSAMSNVKIGIAGLEPTKRAVEALEKFLAAKNALKSDSDNLAKRQKLVIP
jgi:hypothetical protein